MTNISIHKKNFDVDFVITFPVEYNFQYIVFLAIFQVVPDSGDSDNSIEFPFPILKGRKNDSCDQMDSNNVSVILVN